MVNYCIDVGLERKVTSRFTLSNAVYHALTKCGLHSWYAILKNYRKAIRRKGASIALMEKFSESANTPRD